MSTYHDPQRGLVIGFCIAMGAMLVTLAGVCFLGICLGRLAVACCS